MKGPVEIQMGRVIGAEDGVPTFDSVLFNYAPAKACKVTETVCDFSEAAPVDRETQFLQFMQLRKAGLV